MTDIVLTDKDLNLAKLDALAVLVVKDGDKARVADAAGLEADFVKTINSQLSVYKARGASDEVTKLVVPGFDGIVVAVGAGGDLQGASDGVDRLREAAGCAARALREVEHAGFIFTGSTTQALAAVVEGIELGAYTYDQYKSKAKPGLAKATLFNPSAKEAASEAVVNRAKALAHSQNWARDLVNMPSLDLYPNSFATTVRERLSDTGIEVSVMDEEQLKAEGCGGLIGVGRGSARPPRLVKLSYTPAKSERHIAIVGKGITFDSGGLCIKPANGMATMKCDMAGAAAVAAYLEAAAALELPVTITGYLCLAENMTGSNAQRPGDVIRMHDGTTVEIDNTDAEGRLVMADGLCYASELKPDLIIDIATLTGAAVLALGNRTAAVVGNNDDVRDDLVAASKRAGEHIWPMPLLDHIRPSLDSDVADLKHTGERMGGLITAAMFLKEFVGESADGKQTDWLHLDIAAPAFNESGAYGYTPKGGTGFAVRTLIELSDAR